MSRPEPAAAAAGASATKMPAPTIDPSPIVTASKVPSRRCSAGPSGVLTHEMLCHAFWSSPNTDSLPHTVAATSITPANTIAPKATNGIAHIRRHIRAEPH